MRLAEIPVGTGQTRYVVLDDQGRIVAPIARYLKHLDRRGCAPNTLRSYGFALKLFFTYLAQAATDYRQIGVDDLAGFIQWLRFPYGSTKVLPHHPVAPARSNRTINHVLTAVASLYDYLWRVDAIDADLNVKTRAYLSPRAHHYKSFLHHLAQDLPTHKHVLRQAEPRRRPKTLTNAQVETLVAACDTPRDQLLLALLYESGVRIGEALGLWLEDIAVADRCLHVRDRGTLPNGAAVKMPSSERRIDVSPSLIARIMGYVAVAHTEAVTTNHLCLIQRGPAAGQPLGYAAVHDLFLRLARKTGIDASPHVLRDSSLSALARAGWAPEHLRVRAGHAQFQTTYQLYVHPSAENLRAEWERTQGQVHVGAATREGAADESRPDTR